MIDILHYPAPNPGQNRLLLIMLPGVGIGAAEFFDNGMIAAVQAHGLANGLAIDVAALCPDLELYLDGGIVSALHREVIEPAQARDYARIWLVGISLGGMGALRYASERPAEIAGLVLLAPFLGTRGTVAEIIKAGGLAHWSATQSSATEQEQCCLLWLQDFLNRQPSSPALYIGYGEEDRFAPGHRLIADIMPGDHVVTAKGGHDWACWATLWQQLLNRAPFTGARQ